MTYSITYSRGAYTWNLNGFDATSGLTMYYLGDAGHGLTPFHLLTQRGAYQQGETTVDFRKDPRVITLPLLIRAETLETQAHVRDTLIRMFKPSNVAGTLTIVNGAYTRAITVRTVGGLQYENPEGAGYDVKTVVQLRADDPTWYDPAIQTVNATPVIAGTAMPIPLLIHNRYYVRRQRRNVPRHYRRWPNHQFDYYQQFDGRRNQLYWFNHSRRAHIYYKS
jgi:hypothetical protein